jgi:hypothetical protein
VIVHLHESAGQAATISGVDLMFVNGSTTTVSSHNDQPISSSSNVCPPSGSVDTRELVTVDSGASHPYAARVQATVGYSDGTGWTSATSAGADVPPVSPSPPAQTYSLTGAITDASTHTSIAGARLDVLGGLNVGKSAIADTTGTYVLRDLIADSFRLRASADGYGIGEQGVTVPTNPRADFELRRVAPPPTPTCSYTIQPSGLVNIGAIGGGVGAIVTRTLGACGWQASVDVNWLALSSTSGNGNGVLQIDWPPNGTVARTGTIALTWDGGSTQVIIRQGAWVPTDCLIDVTVNSKPTLYVSATGGQYTASITAVPGTPPNLCGPWTADSPLGGISYLTATTGSLPASITFVVQPNPSTTMRETSVNINFATGSPTGVLLVHQSGRPTP